uniref:Uncharacterized protein n=1 Tax=Denticeps clupeoides TaxID=299321 RepID=A0AAY4CJ73_9TELE
MQDGVLNIAEDEPNVLCVDGRGEVVVERLLLLFPPLAAETLHQKILHILQVVRVARVLREVVLDGHRLHFLLQQVCLVEEEDNGDVGKDAVVDYGFEDVERLHQPVGLPVLHQHLVKLTRRDEEEDGGDTVKALEPPPPLRALAAHIHHLEGHIPNLKVVLMDALGGLSCQEDVLVSHYSYLWLLGFNGQTFSVAFYHGISQISSKAHYFTILDTLVY